MEWLSQDQPGLCSRQRVRRLAERPRIRFHQLHNECHSRIRYVKTCPIHGEVSSADIVLGYEYAKDQYVVVDPEELEQLRDTSERAISVDSFVRPEAVDPAFFSGRTYYLVPDGEIGQKPYELIHDAMMAEGLHAIARMVLTKKEHIVRLRPLKETSRRRRAGIRDSRQRHGRIRAGMWPRQIPRHRSGN